MFAPAGDSHPRYKLVRVQDDAKTQITATDARPYARSRGSESISRARFETSHSAMYTTSLLVPLAFPTPPPSRTPRTGSSSPLRLSHKAVKSTRQTVTTTGATDHRLQGLGHTQVIPVARGAPTLLAAKLSVLDQCLVGFSILEMKPFVHEKTEMFIVLWVAAIAFVSHCFFSHRLVSQVLAIAVFVAVAYMSYADKRARVPS